jgi:poly-gamma-glutamate capsule biosynthesis protein CapA/YwtB (metallophosphatase superfamily)
MKYLSILFFSVLWLASCDSKSQNGTAMMVAAMPNTDSTITPNANNTEPKTVRYKFSFIGDIMGHGDQIKAAYDAAIKGYDYEPCFRYVRPIFERDDMTIGNLELTTNSRGVYTGYPRFRSPDTLSYILKAAGFDFLVTANNHSNDDDAKGVIHTLDVLDAVGLPYTGTFRDSAERANKYPLILEREKDGVMFRFAFVNCTYSTNGIPTQAPVIVNLIDTAELRRDIAKAKAAKPDIIIAVIHWGSEYQLNESKEQRKIAEFLYKEGVPVVIGGHPHVIQPIKVDTFLDKDGQRQTGLCTYSLGNFISNQQQKNTDIGLVFELEIEKNTADNSTKIVNHDYILMWRYIYNKAAVLENRVYTVVPVSAFEQDTTNFLLLTPADKAAMNLAAKNMRAHLGKHQSKERLISYSDIVNATTMRPNQNNSPIIEKPKPKPKPAPIKK